MENLSGTLIIINGETYRLTPAHPNILSVDELTDAFYKYTGFAEVSMSRDERSTVLRHCYIYLLREKCRLKYQTLGTFMVINHTTAMKAYEMVRFHISKNVGDYKRICDEILSLIK